MTADFSLNTMTVRRWWSNREQTSNPAHRGIATLKDPHTHKAYKTD